MSERAFSLELNKTISAIEAYDYSIEGQLQDKRAFLCNDPDCQINMTCTHFQKDMKEEEKKEKRFYFTLSSKDEPHVIGCSEASEQDVKKQLELESNLLKESIHKNEFIKITKSIGQAKNNDETNLKTEPISQRNNLTTNLSNKKKSEARNIYSIASVVEAFNNSVLDKDSQIIDIEGEKISLNELFLESKDNDIPNNRTRIFYGEAIIRTAEFGNNMLEIEFIDSKLPNIYSNIKSVSKNKSTYDLKKFLDTDKKVIVYFRGKLLEKATKFEPFNDKVFKDIYF